MYIDQIMMAKVLQTAITVTCKVTHSKDVAIMSVLSIANEHRKITFS